MHARLGPALQARDVHLREADPARDSVLIQVLEEPQDDDLALQLRQPGHQARQAQQIFWLLPGRRRGHQIAQTTVGFLAGRLVSAVIASRTSFSPTSSCSANSPVAGEP
jgi:hypothetical protein